jgi:hypothetical protein
MWMIGFWILTFSTIQTTRSMPAITQLCTTWPWLGGVYTSLLNYFLPKLHNIACLLIAPVNIQPWLSATVAAEFCIKPEQESAAMPMPSPHGAQKFQRVYTFQRV